MVFITGGAYQGKREFAKKNFPECKIMENYQRSINEQMRCGLDPIEEAELLLENEELDRLVILCNEVGGGIVPLDTFERDYRENVGRVSCLFAEKADRVIRVVAGIGVTIKE
ncbi:MAG: bifunctional adenosylcobinamide kinase/adenosylcobinamide-phosphate guanylyltransferase [Lachnospiraceae bacterium]|nr:bifunctional adenosylcobinamide kinase/adenosylcobinamide-phosphate guanylyltransferase [Lachnospiraceae bacterium]